MANPQPTDAHLIMAHTIEEQLMVSDFSEQQGRILRLILRLSWGCGKKWARIDHQSDFEIVRVGQGKVKAHLDWLIASGVIKRAGCYYSFDKDFDHWRVSRSLEYTPDRMSDLVHQNLEDRESPDYRKGKPAEEDDITEKVRENLPKREEINYRKGNISTPELGTAKESVKESVKENYGSSSGIERQPDEEDLFKAFQENIGGITPSIQEEIRIIVKKIPPSWVNDAIKEVGKRAKDSRSWVLVAGVLRNWVKDGRNVGPPVKAINPTAKYTNGKFSHLVGQ